MLGVLGLGGLVSLARLPRLVEVPETPPGPEVGPMLDFLRRTIPSEAGYLFVLPGAFGTDTGTGPRLRYELFPRRYDDVRATRDEASVRQLMAETRLRFVVVPDALQYAETSWLRQPRPWLRRIPFEQNANGYVLEVIG